ncbi:MAG: hypothetical protein MJK14_22535 [Rivularia sp. ALOHA_DT_140]|nr:hypothetical protein [Rivularia sp. ALOHA_DT_140]
MKILYLVLPLWVLVASSSFVQNSIFQTQNKQSNIHEKLQNRPPRRRKQHRGSGRRYYMIKRFSNS